MAAAAELTAWAFPQLPLPHVLYIFSLLPADQRLRAAEVSRAWRATVALPALWRRLDLTPESGVAAFTLKLLHAAVARAGGALTAISLPKTPFADVAEICAASPGLAEARTRSTYPVAEWTALLAAAPQLQLHCGAQCEPAEALEILEGRAPLHALRLHTLRLIGRTRAELPAALTLALADDRLQPDLARLTLYRADFRERAAVEALADVVVARPRLRDLSLVACPFSPAAAAALSRLIRDGNLTTLELGGGHDTEFLDGAGAQALADALRGNSTLTSLTLRTLFGAPAPLMAVLVGSLVGHGSLRHLDLRGTFHDDDAAGAVLAALLAADAPALQALSLSDCRLTVAGLGAMCDALALNTRLHTLDLMGMHVPAGFVRSRFLPAVRANTGLRELDAMGDAGGDDAAQLEAERIVAAR